jgi:hypothetical protein
VADEEPSTYDAMREAIETRVPIEADRETLIAAMENLRAAEETEAFESAYEHLRASAEAYLDELGPFLARFTRMFGI